MAGNRRSALRAEGFSPTTTRNRPSPTIPHTSSWTRESRGEENPEQHLGFSQARPLSGLPGHVTHRNWEMTQLRCVKPLSLWPFETAIENEHTSSSVRAKSQTQPKCPTQVTRERMNQGGTSAQWTHPRQCSERTPGTCANVGEPRRQ